MCQLTIWITISIWNTARKNPHKLNIEVNSETNYYFKKSKTLKEHTHMLMFWWRFNNFLGDFLGVVVKLLACVHEVMGLNVNHVWLTNVFSEILGDHCLSYRVTCPQRCSQSAACYSVETEHIWENPKCNEDQSTFKRNACSGVVFFF